MEAVAVLGVGIAAGRRTEGVRRGQVHLGAVNGDARDNVDDVIVEEAGHALIFAVLGGVVPDRVEGDGGTGDLAGVDVGVDPVGGLFGVGAGLFVGKGGEHDVAALMRFAY